MYGERVVVYRLKEHDYLQSTSMFLCTILQSIQALVSCSPDTLHLQLRYASST